MRSKIELPDAVLVTGATGLVGARVVERLLAGSPHVHVYVLVRSGGSAALLRRRLGRSAARITAVSGDVTHEGAAIGAGVRARLAGRVRAIVHAAADTTFSRSLDAARAVNTTGTRHLLELADAWGVERFVHLSTAFVAGARVGPVTESMPGGDAGFVNGYEQSKYEAELLVRSSGVPHVIVRPSVIICDDAGGSVTQLNAAHRALRVIHAGLAAMMPGRPDTPLDVVTAQHVVDGTVRLGFGADTANGTYHLCAGTGAIALGELLDITFDVWSRNTDWRRRGVARPALTDLATYRLFEQAIESTGDVRLTAITRSLSHFVPQLALPKLFDTRLADSMLGGSAAPVRSFWPNVIEYLANSRWSAARSAA